MKNDEIHSLKPKEIEEIARRNCGEILEWDSFMQEISIETFFLQTLERLYQSQGSI